MHSDVAIIGSGFAGSLMSLVLTRLGRSCVVIDRQSHPRFAEWFEWLAIQFAQPDHRGVPAHEAYRKWKP